jgi:flagellar hook-associated protein 1 FlgK
MTISGLYDIGKSALYTSQAALGVISNNIANVNTSGYSRQDIVLNIATPVPTSQGDIGTGVTVGGIVRSYDKFLQAQLMGQQQSQSRSDIMNQMWGQVEPLFNEQQGAGLSTPLSDFFNAWNDVATSPESSTARTTLLQKASSLVNNAQAMESGIQTAVDNANTSITNGVGQVNTLASDIADLNKQIAIVKSGSPNATPNDLLDQRDAKLTALSKLVDFTSYEDQNGTVTIMVGMRNLVSGNQATKMTTASNADGNKDVFLDGINISSRIQGGQIGGYIASRDDAQSTALTGLRKLVASVTQQVNQLHTTGYDLSGTLGGNFFSPLQLTATSNSPSGSISATVTSEPALTLDEYNISFDTLGTTYTVSNKATGATVQSGAYTSGNAIALPGMSVTISGAMSSANQFTVSPLTTAVSGLSVALTDGSQVAASATQAGVPGDNGIASQIADLTGSANANLGGSSISSYYSGLVASVGTMKSSASDGLTLDNNLLASIQSQRDSVSGVSLDEEAAKLLLYQRSYQAGAKMITVADQLMQTILALGT